MRFTTAILLAPALALVAGFVSADAARPPNDLGPPVQNAAPRYRVTYEFAGPKGPSFDASRWGFERGKAVFFYEHQIGIYPRTYAGNSENGGVPQRVDLTSHLAKVARDVEAKIPDPNWDGYAVLDFESWGPLLAGNQPFYLEESKKLVLADRPGITEPELTRRATRAFESAARTYLERTLRTCKELRPRAKWGFYCYPQPYHAATEQSLRWLWESVDALYPGFYISGFAVDEGADIKPGQIAASVTIKQMRDHAALARRFADLTPDRKDVVFLLSPRYFDVNKQYAWQVLNETDLEITVRLPWLCGADGAIFWDNVRDDADSALLRRYLDEKLGPALEALQREVRARP